MGENGPSVAAVDASPSESASTSSKKVKHLVLDTGALIKGSGYRLASLAEQFWTIPEVIAEVRDPKARFHLETLPFELRTKDPSPEALKAIADFARKTGDYSSLSRVDLRVLALSYTLEAQEVGSVAHLRTELVRPPPRTGPSSASKSESQYTVAASGSAAAAAEGDNDLVEEEVLEEYEGEQEVDVEVEGEEADETTEDEEEEDEEEDEKEEEGEGEKVPVASPEAEVVLPADQEQQQQQEHQVVVEQQQDQEKETSSSSTLPPPPPPPPPRKPFSWAEAVKKAPVQPLPTKPKDDRLKEPAIPVEASLADMKLSTPPSAAPVKGKEGGEVTSRLLGGAAAVGGMTAEDDDDEGWISVENIKEARAKGDGVFGGQAALRGAPVGELEEDVAVACVTTDFGMQNVLLQMGLKLLSVDGVVVRRVKQWARRCESCAKIVHDQERMFCPRCGNAYLSRVSYSIDSETGQMKVHLSKTWRPRKGCKYSIRKAGKGGRFEGEILLREDQLMMGIWRQKVKRRNKEVDSMFGSDITETLGMAVNKPVHQDVHFGYGRKNPNSQRGRERRGKKKKASK